LGLDRGFAGKFVEKKENQPSARLVYGIRVKRVMKSPIAATEMRPGARWCPMNGDLLL
jgi:hypothetical protein